MKKIVVLTGAGISAESGIRTFRDADGLWEHHRIEDVATPEAWVNDPELVLRFYNQRRAQLFEVQPNAGHQALVSLERDFEVHVITQNVDDLHERAGSSRVLHLHGELRKVRSERYEHLVYPCEGEINMGDTCERGFQLRPHIVWFGEAVPMLEAAAELTMQADIFLIVGTSLQVYPAAGLMRYARPGIPFYYIDPKPQVNIELAGKPNLTIIAEPASLGVPMVAEKLRTSGPHPPAPSPTERGSEYP
ncbi:MAG: NAD-dependent deacylase [Saprospiraceae bacterium]|nr:NAD-dependent deacylase [Saprospiraceae bacterium]